MSRPAALVHPIGGNVFCYRDLVHHLPAGRAVYGLQAAGAAGTSSGTSSALARQKVC